MLSLPLITPQSGWQNPSRRPRSDSPPPSGPSQQQTHRQRQQIEDEKKQFNSRSPLALLVADEAAIALRKAAVRNFGAYWIRPPGISKTLQAMTEEEAERLEQAELERQERGLQDMQAQQELEEARQRAAETDAAGQDGIEEERDLDDEIPDADGTTGDVTFNEDSMVDGSHLEPGQENEEGAEQYAEMEEAELTGAARDEEDLGMDDERNLDDSIPEAGSYQHTDTEVEDTDSDSELQNSFAAQSARRSAASATAGTNTDVRYATGLQQRTRRVQLGSSGTLPRSPGNLDLSTSAQESSFMDSSPVVQRTVAGGRGRDGLSRRSRHS